MKLVTEEKTSLPQAARRVFLLPSTWETGAKAYKEDRLGKVGKTYWPLTKVEMELARTKRDLVDVKMKRYILKKAATYFSKESLPGTRR